MGELLRLSAQALLTSHLDIEAEAWGPWGCPGLAGVDTCVSEVCSLDAEDSARTLGAQLYSFALLHRAPIVAPEDSRAGSGQLTAQHHGLPGDHAERVWGCLWSQKLHRKLCTKKGGCKPKPFPVSPPPRLARHTYQLG